MRGGDQKIERGKVCSNQTVSVNIFNWYIQELTSSDCVKNESTLINPVYFCLIVF